MDFNQMAKRIVDAATGQADEWEHAPKPTAKAAEARWRRVRGN